MKKHISMLLVGLASILWSGCGDDGGTAAPGGPQEEAEVEPGEISGLGASSTPTTIRVSWRWPADSATIRFLRVEYFDHGRQRKVAVRCDLTVSSIEVTDARPEYGPYEFTLQAWSTTGKSGRVFTISQSAAEAGTTPADISGLRSSAEPGTMTVEWDYPADARTIDHVRVTWFDHATGQAQERSLAPPENSLTLSGLPDEAEAYVFTVETVSADGNTGTPCRIRHTAAVRPPDLAEVSTAARTGTVVLRWQWPQEMAKASHVEVKYYDHARGDTTRLAVYPPQDSVEVSDALARYGDYVFSISVVSTTGIVGAAKTVSQKSGPAASRAVREHPVVIVGNLWTDSQEATEGPIGNLTDGDVSTYFHMSWTSPTAFPHYIVVDLGAEMDSVRFSYTTRDHSNRDHPREMDVLLSQEFDRSLSKAGQARTAKSLSVETDKLPQSAATSWTSPVIADGQKFRYLWLKIKSSVSGDNWVALSELSVSEVRYALYDPESDK